MRKLRPLSKLVALCFLLAACQQNPPAPAGSAPPEPAPPPPTEAAPSLAPAQAPPASTSENAARAEEEEKTVMDAVFALPEVQARGKYIEEQTKGARQMQLWVAEQPTADTPFYWVKVGEDNGGNLVTHFDFFVYPTPLRIMFYDVAEDKEITLAAWRKKGGK